MNEGAIVTPGSVMQDAILQGGFSPISFFGPNLVGFWDAYTSGGSLDSRGNATPLYGTISEPLLTHSNNLSAWDTATGIASVNQDLADPLGVTNNAWRVTENTANSIHRAFTGAYTGGAYSSGIPIEYEAYVRLVTGTRNVAFLSGSSYAVYSLSGSGAVLHEGLTSGASITQIGAGPWFLLRTGLMTASNGLMQIHMTTGTTTLPAYTGDGSEIGVYQAQSYQPQLDALANRAGAGSMTAASVPARLHKLISGGKLYAKGYGAQLLSTNEADVLSALSGDDPDMTAIFGVRRVGAGAAQTILGARDAVGAKLRLGYDASNQLTVVRDAASLTVTGADDGAWHVVELSASGTSYTLYVDGVSEAAGTVDAGALTMTQAQLYGDGAGGNIGTLEFTQGMLLDRVLTPEERTVTTAYLSQRLP